MIFRYNLYNCLDHWADITHFYFKRGVSWAKSCGLPTKDFITVKDLDVAHKFLLDNTKSIYNATQDKKKITHPDNVFIVVPNDVRAIFIKKEEDSIADNAYYPLLINLETLNLFKNYLFESGIFKYTCVLIFDSIKKKGTNLGGIDNPIPVCKDCTNVFSAFIEHSSGIYLYNELKHVAKRIINLHGQSSTCAANLNYIINRAIASRSLTTSKMLSSQQLNIKETSVPPVVNYSDDLHVVFQEKSLESDASKYTVTLLNKDKDILFYRNGKIFCPNSHFNTIKGYEETCRYYLPSGEDIVKLYNVKYEYHKQQVNSWLQDDNYYSVFGTNLPYVVEHLDSLKNEFCKSNTKKVHINKVFLEQLNVKRNF